MERSLLGSLAGALLGISTLGTAAFVWGGSAPSPPPPKPEGDWRLLDPITYENIFRVIIMQFIDAWSFDVRSVKKTCVHIAHPDGKRIIPFDTYNLFYRDDLERTILQPLRREREPSATVRPMSDATTGDEQGQESVQARISHTVVRAMKDLYGRGPSHAPAACHQPRARHRRIGAPRAESHRGNIFGSPPCAHQVLRRRSSPKA